MSDTVVVAIITSGGAIAASIASILFSRMYQVDRDNKRSLYDRALNSVYQPLHIQITNGCTDDELLVAIGGIFSTDAALIPPAIERRYLAAKCTTSERVMAEIKACIESDYNALRKHLGMVSGNVEPFYNSYKASLGIMMLVTRITPLLVVLFIFFLWVLLGSGRTLEDSLLRALAIPLACLVLAVIIFIASKHKTIHDKRYDESQQPNASDK